MAKDILKGTPWYIHAAFVVSAVLGIASFFVPPYAVIDGSVLAYTGELIGGSSLLTFIANIPNYLEAGVKAKISHGNTTVTVTADDVKDNELDE